MKLFYSFLSAGLLLLSFPVTIFSQSKVIRQKNIPYIPTTDNTYQKRNRLDVYYPKGMSDSTEVLLFIHGGAWRLGNKRMYKFFGKRLAERGKVAVLLNYRLKKGISYRGMAEDCSKGVLWVKEHIHTYHGDPKRIFISGHSAGGHLAALISMDSSFFKPGSSPIQGVILIDAFGLDMFTFLKTSAYKKIFLPVFTGDSSNWKQASPIYHLHQQSPPVQLFLGKKTLRQIKEDNERFSKVYRSTGRPFEVIEVKGKGHIRMMFQFRKRKNPFYNNIMKFLEEPTPTAY